MEVVTRSERGLFPHPREISMKCSCPDWAGMCKHLAATLYGVGARLDEKPQLLFLLRGVDPEELISQASATEAVRQATPSEGAATIAETDLADVFGIELESSPAKTASPAKQRKRAVLTAKASSTGKPRKPKTSARSAVGPKAPANLD